MIVGTLVGVDAIILLVGTAVPTSRLEAMKMEKDGIYISVSDMYILCKRYHEI